MKIMLFSDLHLHTFKTFGVDKETLLSKRLVDQINVLDQIAKIAKDEKLSLIVNGGDTFHLRGMIPVEVINVANNFYDSLQNSSDVANVRGNHDLVSDSEYKDIYDAVRHLKTRLAARQGVVEVNGLRLRLVDYCEDIKDGEIKGYDVVVLHKQPTIVNESGYKFEGLNWKTLAKDNKFVFFGHYHKTQQLADNCFIMGSAMQLEFGDEREHGVYILDTEMNGVRFIKLDYPQFITVDDANEVKDDGNYYRVLNATKKIDKQNVISIVTPRFFEERIKSVDFNAIIDEWLKMNSVDDSYKNVLNGLFDKRQMSSIANVFKGKITGVSIHDFISIKDINFKISNGFTLITGKNELGGSNGSGKSSIFDAILWALFNRTTKGLTGNDVIRRGQKDCSVRVYLEDEHRNTYVIERSRKEGLSICIPSQDDGEVITDGLKQDRRQEILQNEILGFDMLTFMTACYFSQESLMLFTELSDSDRTGIISHLLGFEMYDDLHDKVKICADEKSESVTDTDDKINKIEQELKLNSVKIDFHNKNITAVTDENTNETRQIDVIKEEIKKSQESDGAKKDYVAIVKKKNNELSEISEQKIEINDTNEQNKNEERDIISEQKNIAFKIRTIKADNDIVLKEIDDFNNSKFGEKCDKCGAVITKDNIDIFIDEKKQQIKDNEVEILGLQIQEQECETKISELGSLIVISEKQLRQLNLTTDDLHRDIENLRNEQVKQAKIDVLSKTQSESIRIKEVRIADNMKKIDALQKEVDIYEAENKRLKDNIVMLQNDKAKMVGDIDKLVFWKKAFSNQGIRSILLDKFCNEFNLIVNEYISIISSGSMTVLMTPTKQLKSGDERNKIGIDIFFNGATVKYESLSGGEKKRVDIALCLSLNQWITRRYNIESGLLGIIILDEIFAFLDGLGEDAIGPLLSDEGKNKAIYVISHTNELSAYSDNQVMVEKRDGCSGLIDSKR